VKATLEKVPDEQPSSLSSGFHGSRTGKRSPAPEVTDQEVAAITEASVRRPQLSSDSYPSLDLRANWTGERPSMAQILEELSANEAIDGDRQIDDVVNNWRSDHGTN
jgi:hypothetical protein